MVIYPYKNGSNGAKELADALGIKQIKREGSKFRGSPDKLVINWGSSEMSAEALKCEVLNKPEAVALASNKLEFFRALKQWNRSGIDSVAYVEFTERRNDALEWLHAGHDVVCRTILNGHSGAGIILYNHDDLWDNLPQAPLYTLYRQKKSEYRIHVLQGEVVDIQKKKRRVDIPDDQINWKIRNHDNGFIYARDGVAEETPKIILINSVNAVNACGLDFGAVDVIYNEKQRRPYVLEVNTAPGLTGETLEGYHKRFEEIGTAWKQNKKKKSIKLPEFIRGFGLEIPADYIRYQNVPLVYDVPWPRDAYDRIDYPTAHSQLDLAQRHGRSIRFV